jgi:hypothetical protein
MAFCGAGAVLVVRVLSLERVDMPPSQYLRRVLPAAALYAASLWLSYSALLPTSTWSMRMAKAIMHALVCATVRVGTTFDGTTLAPLATYSAHRACAGRTPRLATLQHEQRGRWRTDRC